MEKCIICKTYPKYKDSDKCESCFKLIRQLSKELIERYSKYNEDIHWEYITIKNKENNYDTERRSKKNN
jgi:hypothetical protein